MLRLWISPTFLEWGKGGLDPKIQSLGDEDITRAYEILSYAQQRLEDVDDDGGSEENLILGDVVKSVREVIENRERLLEKKFNLLSFKGPQNERNFALYKKLEYFGIVKPTMLRNLIDLRNTAVHKQKYPLTKDKKKISEYAEITWYFLRSTDLLFSRIFSGLVCYPPEFQGEKEYFLETGFSNEDFSIENYPGCLFLHLVDYPHLILRANYLSSHQISIDKKPDWLELVLENFNDCDDDDYDPNHISLFSKQFEEEKKPSSIGINYRRTERVNDCLKYNSYVKMIQGEIIGPQELINKINKDYIDLYLYY